MLCLRRCMLMLRKESTNRLYIEYEQTRRQSTAACAKKSAPASLQTIRPRPRPRSRCKCRSCRRHHRSTFCPRWCTGQPCSSSLRCARWSCRSHRTRRSPGPPAGNRIANLRACQWRMVTALLAFQPQSVANHSVARVLGINGMQCIFRSIFLGDATISCKPARRRLKPQEVR